MTREEVEAKAAFLADCLNVPTEREYIVRMITALVVQAYEESQKAVCRCWMGTVNPDNHAEECSAYEIAPLKDALKVDRVK